MRVVGRRVVANGGLGVKWGLGLGYDYVHNEPRIEGYM